MLVTPRQSADIAASLERAGFTVTTLYDAGRDGLRNAFRDFLIDVDGLGDGIGLVYYAGHAAQVNGTNYLLPVDTGS